MPLIAVECPTHKISGGSGIRIWRTFVSLQLPKQSAESKQKADNIRISNFSYLTTLYCMLEVISVEILNFLNFGDDDDDEDEKRLVGLRQASGRRQK